MSSAIPGEIFPTSRRSREYGMRLWSHIVHIDCTRACRLVSVYFLHNVKCALNYVISRNITYFHMHLYISCCVADDHRIYLDRVNGVKSWSNYCNFNYSSILFDKNNDLINSRLNNKPFQVEIFANCKIGKNMTEKIHVSKFLYIV